MTDDTRAFLNRIREGGGEDLLKELAEAVLQRLSAALISRSRVPSPWETDGVLAGG